MLAMPLVRNSAGECGSICRYCSASSSRFLVLPDGGVAQEEALQAGESVHFGGGIEQCLDGGGGAVFFGVGLTCRLAERECIRLERDGSRRPNRRYSRRWSARRSRAVPYQARQRTSRPAQRHKAVVLGDQCAGTGLEVLAILVGPPVVELAVAVVLEP